MAAGAAAAGALADVAAIAGVGAIGSAFAGALSCSGEDGVLFATVGCRRSPIALIGCTSDFGSALSSGAGNESLGTTSNGFSSFFGAGLARAVRGDGSCSTGLSDDFGPIISPLRPGRSVAKLPGSPGRLAVAKMVVEWELNTGCVGTGCRRAGTYCGVGGVSYARPFGPGPIVGIVLICPAPIGPC